MKLPAKLSPENVRVICDNREQQPWNLDPLQVESGTLQSGDYSLAGDGLRDLIRIERKSMSDLVGVVGGGRERFEREIERLQAFPTAVLVVEANWADIDAGDWRAKATPKMVRNSLGSWMVRGINVVLAGNRERAQELARELLYRTAAHSYRQLRQIASEIDTGPDETELRVTAMELRGCGATVQQISRAMSITQSRVQELTS